MKHKDICEAILSRIRRFGGIEGICMTEEEYLLNTPPIGCSEVGEIDVYCVSPRFNGVFEVKTTDTPRNRKKALKQLDKDVQYMSECYGIDDVVKMYAYTDPSRHRGYNIEKVR